MSEQKHTPGPWHRNVPPARQYPTVFAGRNTHIAALRPDSRISDEEAEANLNLIAAAPDLLAACEAAREQIQGYTYSVCNDPALVRWAREMDARLSTAIAAARGEEQP